MTREQGLEVFGSQLACNYYVDNVGTSSQFNLSSAYFNSADSINVAPNAVFNSTNNLNSQIWLIYSLNIPSSARGTYIDIDIDIPVYFSDSARGAFCIQGDNLTTRIDDNSRVLYPYTYFNNITGISMNTQADSSNADFYGYFREYLHDTDGYNYYFYFRPIVYDFTGGQQINTVHFGHIKTRNDETHKLFAIALPVFTGEVHSGIETTVTTVTTAIQEINVSVNINLDDTNSKIDGIAGDVQSVKDALEGNESSYPVDFALTVPTYPITFDDSVIDDGLTALDDVPDELAAGGFWFKLIYDILHGSPLWLLVPLLIVLALARWVIWKG